MSKLVVAAIDIGTTFSGLAYSFKHKLECAPVKISTKGWTSVQIARYKGPTCLLINPDGKTLNSFGYDAENKYAELARDGRHGDYYFFQRFKMMLFNQKKKKRNMLLEDSSGKKLPGMTVLALVIQYLKNNLLYTFTMRMGGIETGDIQWVLTVPAISNVAAKQFMRKAAEKAGIPRQNITIVSEPQAASVFCRFLPQEKFVGRDKTSLAELKIGTKYIVLDAGGTSVKCSVYEKLSENKVNELLTSAKECGGTNVDDSFEDFLGEIVGKVVLRSFKDTFNEDFLDLFRDFEEKKWRLNKKCTTVVRIPDAFFGHVITITGKSMNECVKSSRYKNIKICGHKLKIDSQVMRSFYGNVVTNIIRHVESLLKNPIASDCSAIVMVGGFSESIVLQESIQEKFNGLKIIVPEEASLAIQKGAAVLGQNLLFLEVERIDHHEDLDLIMPAIRINWQDDLEVLKEMIPASEDVQRKQCQKMVDLIKQDEEREVIPASEKGTTTTEQEKKLQLALKHTRLRKWKSEPNMSRFLVVALDIGTTYTSFSVSFKYSGNDDPQIQFSNISRLKTTQEPTCVLIEPDGLTVKAFGYEAEAYYAKLADNGDHQKWYFFKNFTRKVYDSIESNNFLQGTTIKSLPAKTVFFLSIKYLQEHRERFIRIREMTAISTEVRWVFTLPDIGYDASKAFIKETAVAAGIPERNIFTVSVAQAASVFCRYLPVENLVGKDKTLLTDLKIGAKYIVLDAGGNNVCLTVHEIISSKAVRELHRSETQCRGTVDDAFEEFLEEIFGKAFVSTFKEHCSVDFEVMKLQIQGYSGKKITLSFPRSFCDLVSEMTGKTMKKYVKKSRFRQSLNMSGVKLKIDIKVIQSFFNSAMTNIISFVEMMQKNPIMSDCSAIVMVGRFSNAELLHECMKEKLSSLKIIIPREHLEAVITGAFIYGHDPKTLVVERTGHGIQETRQKLPSYKMDRRPRGWCIIINNEIFARHERREGTQHDKARLKEVFRDKLHFAVECRDNLKHDEMVSYLIDVSNRIDHSSFDCFVCCVLSHGEFGNAVGSDSRTVPIKELTSVFNAFRCPSLKGKPKLFFIQACQGEDDMLAASSIIARDACREETIPLDADFLFGYATVPGYVSYRHRQEGSFYILALCNALTMYSNRYHLLDILTEVNRMVAKRTIEEGGGVYKQIPAPQSTLTKRLYFN